MGIIDESNADVMGLAFTDTDAMPGAETVTYKPHGGVAVTIAAQITRQPPEIPPEGGRGMVWNILAFVRNHATLGRTSVNVNGDAISVASEYGGTAEDHAVVQIVEQSAAGWILLLR